MKMHGVSVEQGLKVICLTMPLHAATALEKYEDFDLIFNLCLFMENVEITTIFHFYKRRNTAFWVVFALFWCFSRGEGASLDAGNFDRLMS